MIPIKYVTGDATEPQGEEPKIIAHICNDANVWGAGFVMALSARDKTPEYAYHLRWLDNPPVGEGMIQLVPFTAGLRVCNMIAQHGFGEKCPHCGNSSYWPGDCIHCQGKGWIPPIRYTWLASCLNKLRVEASLKKSSVHMPRIGCGLAGGSWDKVGALVEKSLSAYDVPVTVYDLFDPNKESRDG